MKKIKARLKNITFDMIEKWAGSGVSSRARQYIKKVNGLSRIDDSTLAAWVSGTEEYATSVTVTDSGNLECICTCPYSGPCKHAVSVILAAADVLKREDDIPLLDEDDELYEIISEEKEYLDKDGDEDFLESGSSSSSEMERIRSVLSEKTREELIELFMRIAGRDPDIRKAVLENEQLEKGHIRDILKSLRRQIHKVTGENAWKHHWDDESNLPDYSEIKERLRALLDNGYPDEIIELGNELWEGCSRQIAESDDDGITADAVSKCMDIVLQALPRSSMKPSDQILWILNKETADEYDILEDTAAYLDTESYNIQHWLEVAGQLEKKFKSIRNHDYSDYRKRQVLDQLVMTYKKSGCREKIIPLMEKEVDNCNNYEDLVKTLLEAGENEKARRWCKTGFENTINNLPGIALHMQNLLAQMALDENRHDLFASYKAEEFFDNPCLNSFLGLTDAADRAGCLASVREAAIKYLDTGIRPDHVISEDQKYMWPLPAPDVSRPMDGRKNRYKTFPDLSVMIDIAIYEKRLDDAVSLYESMQREAIQNGKYRYVTMDLKVADAVIKSHPQVALDIWRKKVDSLIAMVKPSAYNEAAEFLKKMRMVYDENNRSDEWDGLINELRKLHKPKRKLMEILDILVKKGILF